jgi:hypothetical protein
MVYAARSFDLLERCATTLHSGPLGVAGEADVAKWPIVSLQVQLPVVQRWLNELGRINIAVWSDVRWVLRLEDAHADALLRLDAVAKSLCATPPGTGSLNGRLTDDIRKLAEALHELRWLIAQQCPEVLCAP